MKRQNYYLPIKVDGAKMGFNGVLRGYVQRGLNLKMGSEGISPSSYCVTLTRD